MWKNSLTILAFIGATIATIVLILSISFITKLLNIDFFI